MAKIKIKLSSKTAAQSAFLSVTGALKPVGTTHRPRLQTDGKKVPQHKNRPPKPKKPEHGRQIFVFNHLQKNMMVYSLTSVLNNNAALSQLPYNGKKSVPAKLRKDLWHPFAQISFEHGKGDIGQSVFQKLREYRKRHELEWDESLRIDPKSNRERSRKLVGRMLCDQKANTVADIAAVLSRLAESPDAEVAEEGEANVIVKKKGGIGLLGEGTGARVEVLWRDMIDAEFAETWADNVEHGPLRPIEEFEEEIVDSEEVEGEEGDAKQEVDAEGKEDVEGKQEGKGPEKLVV